MRRLVIASFVVAAACSDDGVPQDSTDSSASADETSDEDTLPSTVTVDPSSTDPSTDPSGTSEDAETSGEATTGLDPSDATSSDATTSTDAGSTSETTASSSAATESSSDASSSESTGGAPVCGDGIVQGDETCDGDDLGDNETCADLGYMGGPLGCDPAQCQYDESMCNDEPAYAIDFCRLQFPTSYMGAAGQVVDVFGRLYIAGLTEQSQGNDVAANVAMQVGYGADGSDPEDDASWAWSDAGPNVGYGPGSPGFEMNNDEYSGQMILPPAGEYDFAVRFTGDGGATWTVCDGGDAGSSNGYAPADAGQLSTM